MIDMLSLYSGTPGSGKSLHVAERIYIRGRRKLLTIGNFEINKKAIKKKGYKKIPYIYLENSEITPEKLIEISQDYFAKKNKPIKEDEILLVLDEAQIIFNARNWQQVGRDKWLSFFTQHRKYGYEIVLIAQFDGMIDKQIRSLIEYQFIHRKVSNFGIIGKLMAIFALGKLFVAVQIWYPLGERIGSEMFVARKKYYSIYNTFADFGTAADLKKALPDKTESA